MTTLDLTLPGAQVRFTGRSGGISEAPFATLNLGALTGDTHDRLAENRRRAADGLPIAYAEQVHGVAIAPATGAGQVSRQADGLLTAEANLALMVTTADCLPVALASGDAVAMVHAGWRGLAAGILEAGVAALAAISSGARIHAAIGPGAGACCYEVGPEVAAAFPADAVRGGHLDLKGVAAARLRDAGVVTIDDVQRCTMCEPEVFFSHRRSGPITGRQAGLIWRA